MSYDAPEFDEALGLHGLHQVRPQVGLQRRETILPPDLFEQYSKLTFWQHPANSRASVITPKMQPEAPLKRAAP